MTPDFFKDAFRVLLESGKTHLEAYQSFDPKEWNEAMLEEMDGVGYQSEMLRLVTIAGREEMNERDLGKATELWLAGWKSETPYPQTQKDIMSWYWRRPPRGNRKKGRLFLSTDQAYNALLRETKTQEKGPA